MKKTLFLSFSLLLLACTKEIDSSKMGTNNNNSEGVKGDTTKTVTTSKVTGGTTGDTTKSGTKPIVPGGTTVDTSKTGSVIINAAISSLNCGNVQFIGTLLKGLSANSVGFTISYLGGNGKNYNSQTISSTGVTGLTATLQAGTLENGNGSINYVISGKPLSIGIATFELVFIGKTCMINLVVSNVQQPTSGYGENLDDIEGNIYKTIFIGTQQWMAENLKVSSYNDGTTIPNIIDKTQWSNLKTGAWVFYNNDPANNITYGKLYNWYVINTSTNGNKNVCPTGWHVPTDYEWSTLMNYLGVSSICGGKMKEMGTSHWNSPNMDATNSSLFTGLPGGSRVYNGIYEGIYRYGSWWSSTLLNTSDAWNRALQTLDPGGSRNNNDKRFGMSIRCIKD